jgi:hypothetical protein
VSVLVYVFRDSRFSPGGEAVASATSSEIVTLVFGGGGHHGEDGLATQFGRAAFFRNDETGRTFLGVWGSRNASRFRGTLRRRGLSVEIVREPPPGRLTWFQTPAHPSRKRYGRELE